MFIPHVMVPHRRRDGRKPTPRQRLAAGLSAVVGSLISVGVGVGFSSGNWVVLACVIAGLAFVGGIALVRVIGRQSRV